MFKQSLKTMGVLGAIVCIPYSSALLAEGPDTLWTKTYGGTNSDYGYLVQQTTDGGHIIVGETNSFGAGLCDVWLLKTDASGDTLWTKTYGGTGTDAGRSVQQTTDNGYIIVGNTDSFHAGDHDVWLLKTDANGDTLWTKTYGGTGIDAGQLVQQTTDNGYIIIGYTSSWGAGYHDVWLLKTDASGDTLWTKTYGGTGIDIGQSVQQTTDGGHIIVGETNSFGAGLYDVWLLKTDASGDTLWTKTYGGTGTDAGRSVQQTTDNGYIIVGNTDSFGAGGADVWLLETDANGDTLWTKTYGGTGEDKGRSVRQTTDNGYIIVGNTDSFGAGGADVWLLRISGEPGIEEADDDVITAVHALSQNYPNPFKVETDIHYQLPQPNMVTITVYNASGQHVKTLVNEPKDAGYYVVHWDGQSQDNQRVSNGVYFCRMVAGEYDSVKKILLIR